MLKPSAGPIQNTDVRRVCSIADYWLVVDSSVEAMQEFGIKGDEFVLSVLPHGRSMSHMHQAHRATETPP